MVRKTVACLCLALALAACVTQYGPMGLMGGVDDLKLNDTDYRIVAKGNGNTDNDRIQDFVLLRAAQIAIGRGFKGFVIDNSEDQSRTSQFVLPGYATTNTVGSVNTNTFGSVTSYGNTAVGNFNTNGFGSASTTATYMPPTTLTVFKPGEAVVITLVNSGGMDAKAIFDSLAPKYGVTSTTSLTAPAATASGPTYDTQDEQGGPPRPSPNAYAPSDDAKSWFQKSADAANRSDWPEVVRTSSVAITKDPNYAAAYVQRSVAYLNLNFLDRASSDIDQALKLDPANTTAINNRGVLRRDQGRRDEAIQDFATACRSGYGMACNNYKALVGYLPSEKPQKLLEQSVTAFNKGDWAGVVSLTSEAISLNPNLEWAWVNRSGANANLGNYAAAISDADRAIGLDPDLGMAYQNKAVALEKSGHKQDAALVYAMACHLQVQAGCGHAIP